MYNFQGVSHHKTYYRPRWEPTFFYSQKRNGASDLLDMFNLVGVCPPEVLRTIRYETFGLAVLDVRMAGLDGFRVLKRLSALAPELPVVFLAGRESALEGSEGGDKSAFEASLKHFSPSPLARARPAAEQHKRQIKLSARRVATALSGGGPCPFAVILDGLSKEVVAYPQVRDMTREQIRAQLDETTFAFCRISSLIDEKAADGDHLTCPCLDRAGEAYLFFGILSKPCRTYEVPDQVLKEASMRLRSREV